MPTPRRPLLFVWFTALGIAFVTLAWVHGARLREAARLTNMAEWSCDAPGPDAGSPTGYVGNTRRLVAGVTDPRALEWIAEVQGTVAGEGWRQRTTAADNAPRGRPTNHTMPHRLWLAALAKLDALATSVPAGLAVERAAGYADPLAHVLGLLAVSGLAAWRLGFFSGGLMALGAAAWFPAAGQFVAAAPHSQGLAWMLGTASVLLLVAGVLPMRPPPSDASGPRGDEPRQLTRWFAASGITGGLALWSDTAAASPVLLASAVGATVLATTGTGAPSNARGPRLPPWLAWGLGGGAVVLIAFFLEYGSTPWSWDIEQLNPSLGVAWLGAGDLLARLARARSGGRFFAGRLDALQSGVGAIMLVSLPAGIVLGSPDTLWVRDPLAGQWARAVDTSIASNLAAWLAHADNTAAIWAAALPLPILALAMARLRSRTASGKETRPALLFLLVAAVVTFLWACLQVRAWTSLQSVLLALATVLGAGTAGQPPLLSRWPRRALVTTTLAAGAAGLAALWPPRGHTPQAALPAEQITRLFERDLAHWLRLRAGSRDVTILAPPATSVSLVHHGGFRGVCSLHPDNKEGFSAAVRIVAATTFEEARTLIEGRGITHLIFPSWDPTLDRYAGFGLGTSADSSALERAFIMRLRRGLLPDWLRLVPQQLPTIPGLPNQSVAVFEVVDEQEHAEALSRLAEAYVELGEVARAVPLVGSLRQYPGDLGARAALVQVAAAQGDRAGLAKELDAIHSLLRSDAQTYLSWDRRLSLAIVLAQARQTDAARAQLRRCMDDADESLLRAATAGELYRLLLLGRRFDFAFADPDLTALAMQLLPPEFRAKL